MVDLTPQFVDDAAGFAGDRISDVAGGIADLGGFAAKTAAGAWDLATDPIEAIYAEARKGLSWLEDQLAEVADFAVHPIGDATSLRTAASAWAAVVRAVDAEGRTLEGAAPGLAATWKGPHGDAYLDGVRATTASMADVEATAREVQRLLERGADTIEDLNRQVQLLVAETVGWLTLSAVVGLLTGGLGLAGGAARIARTVQQVKSLVARARAALVALHVARAVRLSAIGYKVRKTAELTGRGRLALAGAQRAAAASRSVSAGGRRIASSRPIRGLAASGRRAGRRVQPLNPVGTAKRRVAFGSATASSALSTSLAKPPSQWTAEDIARMVAGGYLTAVHGDQLTALLKNRTRLGEVGRATVQSATFGVTSSAVTQAGSGGGVDPLTTGLAGLTGGVGGGLGRGSVRRRLDRDALGDVHKERIKGAGRLGVEGIGEGRLQDRVAGLREGAGAQPGPSPRLLVTPRPLDLPMAPAR